MLLALQVIAENETAFFRRVTVEVNVELEISILVLLYYCFFGLVNRRLLMRTRIQVESIQVVVVRVQPVIASSNAVRVQQWNYFELVLFE